MSDLFFKLKNWLVSPACYVGKRGLEFRSFTLSWINGRGDFCFGNRCLICSCFFATEPKSQTAESRPAIPIDESLTKGSGALSSANQSKKKSTGKKSAGNFGSAPCVFDLNHDYSGLWLGDYSAELSSRWDPGREFLFRLRKFS